jgi:predicted nucleic acid-binding protein
LDALTSSIDFFHVFASPPKFITKLSSLVLDYQEQSEVSKAEWIEVKAVQNPAGLYSAQRKYGLGPGEMSTILLAKELGANPVLLDDYRARKLAKVEGLEILGTVGLLEAFYLRRYLTDLRSALQQLLMRNVYIDQRLLDRRLRALGLPPL